MHVHVQVLRGETAKCRYMVCNYHSLTGRKRDRLLDSTALDVPNPKCGVCLPSMCLVVDTTAFTVGDLIDAVVMKRLGFSRRAARAPHRAPHQLHRQRGEGHVDEHRVALQDVRSQPDHGRRQRHPVPQQNA